MTSHVTRNGVSADLTRRYISVKGEGGGGASETCDVDQIGKQKGLNRIAKHISYGNLCLWKVDLSLLINYNI